MSIFNWIRNLLFVFAVAILISAAACMALGLRPSVVMSGSMEPSFHVGSVVMVKKGAEVKVGDAVAFYRGEMYVTHRIVGTADDGGYITKGDANETEDPSHLQPGDVVGKVVLCIPLLGYVFHFLSTKPGIIIAAALILCLILSMFMAGPDDEEKGSHWKKREGPAKETSRTASAEVTKELAATAADTYAADRYEALAREHETLKESHRKLSERYRLFLRLLLERKLITEEVYRKELAVIENA